MRVAHLNRRLILRGGDRIAPSPCTSHSLKCTSHDGSAETANSAWWLRGALSFGLVRPDKVPEHAKFASESLAGLRGLPIMP
jgi:hypothetical protein